MGCSNSTMQTAMTPRAAPTLQREKTGFVAFEIDLKNNKSKELNKNIDEILSRQLPPKKLQALESKDTGPRLTAEELEMKLILADEKRQRTIEKKMEFSRRASLRRQSSSMESKLDSTAITEKMNAAENMRAQRLTQIQSQQRQRNERVTKIRDEIRRKREGLDELESEFNEVECKESSDDESWQGTGQKFKALPPIIKSKFESGTESSGYSSRNISATQAHTTETMTKICGDEDEAFDNENIKYTTKKSKSPLRIIDNFYDNDLSQESDVDLRDTMFDQVKLNNKF